MKPPKPKSVLKEAVKIAVPLSALNEFLSSQSDIKEYEQLKRQYKDLTLAEFLEMKYGKK